MTPDLTTGEGELPVFTTREICVALATLAVLTDAQLDNIGDRDGKEVRDLALRCRIIWATDSAIGGHQVSTTQRFKIVGTR